MATNLVRFRSAHCLVWLALVCASCGRADRSELAGEDSSLLHLSERLATAAIDSAGAPPTARQELRWSGEELASKWRTISSTEFPSLAGVELELRKSGLRLSLTALRQAGTLMHIGGLVTDLDELRFEDWQTVLVRARTSDRFAGVTVAYDVENAKDLPGAMRFFSSSDEAPPLFNDGSEQTYAIPLRPREGAETVESFTSLGVFFGAPGAASVEILSVALVARGAGFQEDTGVRAVSRNGTTRDTLFAHAPEKLTFPVSLAPRARLDFGTAVNRGEVVTYRVRAVPAGATPGEPNLLFEETVDDPGTWQQHSVDLSALSGQTETGSSSVELVLEASSEQQGAVALWGAPILSGEPESLSRSQPNVIFYVIDGGDANLMSLYGYERPTTGFLEELAKEGVLFSQAYSNATWTQPSTVSFMTSLQHSVLGGLRRGVHSTAVPLGATTMAEHFRRGGYQTASLTANPNAGRIIGLERGVDVMRDVETEHHSTSSIELQEHFWEFWRRYPGRPYWVHFQTTDVHEPNQPHEPFAGRWVTSDEREQLKAWDGKLWQLSLADFGTTSIVGFYDLALARAGIDRQAYFGTRKGLYDETMTHQDHALEKLVTELKEAGEWENTLLIVASDHGHPAGTFARFGRGLFDPQPEPWQGALFDAYATRVPLLVVYAGRIQGGRRIDRPVSMIDVLPTLLELVDLPAPEVLQGQSLAPLLRGEEMEVRPVILDEFRVDEATGEMIGNLEIIDGRWGASLEIGPVAEGADPALGRHSVPAGGRWGAVHPFFPEVPRLLLYDLQEDPFALRAVNDEHPDLVRHYTKVLLEQWRAHRALATRFADAGEVVLDAQQLEQLRSLGYIQ